MFGRSKSRRALRKTRTGSNAVDDDSSGSNREDPVSAASVCTSITSNLKQLDQTTKDTVRVLPRSPHNRSRETQRREFDDLFALEDELLAIVKGFQHTSLIRKKTLETLITNNFSVFRSAGVNLEDIQVLERVQNTVNSLISFVMLLNQTDQPADEFDDMNPRITRCRRTDERKLETFNSIRRCYLLYTSYSRTILAPRPSSVALSFSESSLVTFSLSTFGALSTNFLDSTSDSPSSDLISLMILGLDLASKDSSLTENMVFSWGCSLVSASSASAAAGAGAAAPAAGNAMSGMLSLVFNSWIKNEVSSRVRVEIWSTICEILGSTGLVSVELNLTRRPLPTTEALLPSLAAVLAGTLTTTDMLMFEG
ncbi:hypothetical protein OGAPHI_007137 [Ogataea philodendri]|uniref:Uncharacterized protein n=1 Tax=Ogataea philodendri TaxID=1378263 RepID=A0A9P8NWK1_9ASCO|nr:uncharacterized protein OGAPHI_007137 [Ogataea philodendri]KAH3660551.1 hypothetical protein OGAPHI_007137 [Ogataea philodendri]